MVKAEEQKEHVIEVVKHWVSNCIVKPFNPETLMAKINKIFEGK